LRVIARSCRWICGLAARVSEEEKKKKKKKEKKEKN